MRAFTGADTSGVVHDREGKDEWCDLGSFECEAPLQSLIVKCHWKDQGRGDRKGRIRARLIREGVDVCEVDVFGPCGRRTDSYGYHVYDEVEQNYSQEDELVGRATQGDTLSFEYMVGLPGSVAVAQELHIHYFEAIPEYAGPPTAGDASA